MIHGAWLVSRSVSLFFRFPFCSSSPMSASIAQDGVEGFTLCASIPFLFLVFLLLFSFLLSPFAHQLPALGWMVSPSAPSIFLRSFLFVSSWRCCGPTPR